VEVDPAVLGVAGSVVGALSVAVVKLYSDLRGSENQRRVDLQASENQRRLDIEKCEEERHAAAREWYEKALENQKIVVDAATKLITFYDILQRRGNP